MHVIDKKKEENNPEFDMSDSGGISQLPIIFFFFHSKDEQRAMETKEPDFRIEDNKIQ